MNKIFTMGLLSAAFFISGCASVSQSNLYWGDYSKTLYEVKKSGTAEAHKAHEAELLSIVEESQNRELRVPPGVYAELGLYALERGEKSVAEGYFNSEQQIYPESEVLLENTRKLIL